MNTRFPLGFLASLLGLSLMLSGMLVSCSSGQTGTPISPGMTGHQDAQSVGSPDRMLWGMWHVSIDPATMTAEIAPLRTTDFTANVTRFMQPPGSPTHQVSFVIDPSSDAATGHFIIDVTLKHPFPGMNQYNGFDVRGILFSNGSLHGTHDSTVIRPGPGETTLLNADGYTRWWNWPEFISYETIFGATQGKLAPPIHATSTVNGYKYFAQGLNLTDPVTALDPASRGFFPTTPGVFSRRYDIQFKMDSGKPVLDFNYAVDASWDQPDPSFAPTYPPEAFPISANCQEAYNVSVNDGGSTAYYVDSSTKGGAFHVQVEVYDWQGGAKLNVPGEVSGIWLEGDVLGGPVDVLASASILPGTTANSSIYDAIIVPSNLTGSGDFELFGTVESADPSTFQPQVKGGSSFHYPSAPLAAYFTTTVTVTGSNPSPPPTITAIDPNKGIPDCTEEHVTVTGTNFVNGTTFRLEKSGQTAINATNVVFVNATTLEGDLLLTDAAFSLWDVTVENPDLQKATLANGFTVSDVLYVDGDNLGDPSQNGSTSHPFDTIQKGIDAAFAQSNQPVIVDQSASPYAPFALKNNSHVIGCNWNGGTGWPTVHQTASYVYGNSVNNVIVEGLAFDVTVSNGYGMVFNSGNGIKLNACQFSGICNPQDARLLTFGSSSNVEVCYSEFKNVFARGDDLTYRLFSVICGDGVQGFAIHHCEIHHCGWDQWSTGNNYTIMMLIRVINGAAKVDYHNLLIYDIFDATDANWGDPGNNLDIFEVSGAYGDYFKLYNVTVDDIRHADTPSTTSVQSGHVEGMYIVSLNATTRILKNNIASNFQPTDDIMHDGVSSYFGWWGDGMWPAPWPQPMDYSDVFNVGKPLPAGANWSYPSGYVNAISKGVGCWDNTQDIDPVFDMTPGSNFYHTTNALVSQGGDDGGEMGAFGGPDGDWIPPSQM